MIDKGQWCKFGQDTGDTPLLYTRSAMGFLMTTECQDLGLTSHPKDGGGNSPRASNWLETALHTHIQYSGIKNRESRDSNELLQLTHALV